MPANKALDKQAIAIEDIQRRCKLAAEQLEALAGSPNDLIKSCDPNQSLFLEAASLLRGYHQCLLVESVLSPSRAGKPRKKNAATAADDEYFRSGTRYPGQ